MGLCTPPPSLSRGLGMERERGSGSTSKCSLLCLLLFQNVGRRCGVNSWTNPPFPGQLLECFTTSVRELPLWRGAQGFWCHSYHFQQLPGLGTVCNSALLTHGNWLQAFHPSPPAARTSLARALACARAAAWQGLLCGPGCLLPEASACLPVPRAGPGQYASQLSLPLVIPPPLK